MATEVKGALNLFESAADVAPAGEARLGVKGGVLSVSNDGDDYAAVLTSDSTIANAEHADDADTATLAATATAPESASVFAATLGLDWRQTIARQVQALDATLSRLAISSDCVNLATDIVLTAATGTGNITSLTDVKGGGINVTSGGTAGGLRIGTLGSSSSARVIANSRTDHYAIYCRVKFIGAPGSGADQQTVMCNVFDGSHDICLGNQATISQVNFTFGDMAIGPTNTGIPFGSTWHDLLIWNDGTNLTAYVDGVQAGQFASTGIATAAGVARIFAYNALVTETVNYHMTRWAVFTAEAA